MKAVTLILALVAAPAAPFLQQQAVAAQTAPRKCCCCKSGVCRCGCAMPLSPGETESPARQSRFCGCDDLPLALPPASETQVARPMLTALLAVCKDDVVGSVSCRRHLSVWPHGPPASVDALSTVILIV